ncbi:hypothetical protein CEP52_002866 [Fusarium oligoseptatum]|uniref:Lincomycin-condensing protein lmbA n=1 Tax=Fusarium oligoseptatum TaxID=2604345 RepID=A0A428UBI9_9HYPO|nr:hypothetical protein CEP52_002866 [Fusarium oligoseptatum]
MHTVDSIFCCVACRSTSTRVEPAGAITNEKTIITHQPVPYSDDAADQFVNILQTHSGSRDELHRRLNEVVSANGWTESLAEAILQKMEKLIKEGAKMAQPMADAIKKATDTALEFATEHPVYTALIAAGTIVAIGVFVIFRPRLGIECPWFRGQGAPSCFAARWMSQIGNVSKGSIYAFLQRLGMVLK